jgi:glycosyltransferase involved in cell wall biosynthesis
MQLIRLDLDHLDYNKGDPIKLIYTSTPWRGLNVLLAAMQLVTNKLVHLDVYSSTQVYGDNFKSRNDDQFKGLYEQASNLPNVSYIGYKPNEFIKDNLKNYHMFAYPNIWEETSCAAHRSHGSRTILYYNRLRCLI